MRLLKSEDRDRAFELLEDYIERESGSGEEREDFDRIRGLVPHMRKRLWKAPSKEQVQEPSALGLLRYGVRHWFLKSYVSMAD